MAKASRSKGVQKQKTKKASTAFKKNPAGNVQALNAKDVIKEFDKLCKEKRLVEAQAYLNSLRGLKKWQKLNLQSIIEFKKGDFKTAEAQLREAAREPDTKYGVHKNLAGLLCQQGRMREALPIAKKAYLDTNKKELPIIHLYINCLLDLGKSEEALEACDDAKQYFPDDKTILVSHASALRSVMRNEEAVKEIDDLMIKFPKEPVIVRIKADLLGDTDSAKALEYYEEAHNIAVNDKGREDPAVKWNMSLHLLRNRKLKRGWECWEEGFHPVVGTMGRNLPKRITDMPRADSPDVEIDPEKWTIICSEQGIGDQVLFMHNMLETLEELKNILFICEQRMHPIIKRSFPNMVVGCAGVTYDWTRTTLKKNGYIPLGSIPRRHRNTVDAYLQNRKPYLIANKNLYDKYKTILSAKANKRPIIGISWKGGYWQIQRKTKELEIEKWLPIFKKDALFVNLQYGDVRKEIEKVRDQGFDIVDFPELDFKVHLDDWVAIAGACSGIISVSTALVHFAGAIGQKVAVVMPSKQGPWHLGLHDEESMAYKNVRIYRPQGDEPIDKLVERVASLIIA